MSQAFSHLRKLYKMNKIKILISMLPLIMAAMPSRAQEYSETLLLDVEKCKEMALASSEDIQKMSNSQLQSKCDEKIALSGFLPSFEATGAGLYMTPDFEMSGMSVMMKGAWLAGVMLTQPIYAGGKIAAGRRMSKIGSEAAGQQMRKTRAEVTYEVVNAYWTYVAVLDKRCMMNMLAAQLDTLFAQVDASVGMGMATDADLLTVKAKRSEVEYQMRKVENGVELCRMALCRVIGVPFDTRISVDGSFDTEAGARIDNRDISVEARPEMKLLEAQVEVSRQQVRMTRGDYLPTVALTAGCSHFGNMKMSMTVSDGAGGYVPYEQKLDQNKATFMLGVSIPIFKWGQGSNKVKKAKLDVDNAELELQKNGRYLELEAAQASFNLTDSYNLLSSAQDALEQAEENLRMAGNRYEARMSALSDYLDAKFQWQQAKSNLIEARTQTRIAETDYLRATGRLVE